MEKRAITPAQIKAVTKYEAANYDKILLRTPKGKRDIIKANAKRNGESINVYILKAVDDRIKKDEGE